MEKVVVIGASGHGIVIADILKSSKSYELIGFIDSYKEKGTKILDLEVLGPEEALINLKKEFGVSSGIIGIGDNHTRRSMANKILNLMPDFKFINAIHESAIVADSANMGCGVVAMGGTVINPGVHLEDHVIVNTKSSVGHHSTIGCFASIAPGVTIGGNVSLGTLSALSIGTVVVNNINIGENTLIGAGSLVLKDFADNEFAFGSPARTIRLRKLGDPSL